MASTSRAASHIELDELASNLVDILNRVARERGSIVVERDGTPMVVVRPAPSPGRIRPRRAAPAAAYDAFLAAAGSWQDVDIERFQADNAESRARSSRPAVGL